jgi:hypothetical protein
MGGPIMKRSILTLVALSLGLGCPGGDDTQVPDSAPPGDTADTGAPPHGTGLLYWEGEATVTGDTYDGHEDIALLADKGMGNAVCRIRYAVTSTALRSDCGDQCLWAFDVVLGPAEVLTDTGACGAAGYDEAAVAALEGTSRAYGYIDDYIGHAAVLMVDLGEGWEVADYAAWTDTQGGLSYHWEQGYTAY